jgi:hypothetical protein
MDWILPWETEVKDYPHPSETRLILIDKLENYGYNLELYKQAKRAPNARIMKMILNLLDFIEEKNDEHGVPWILVACNDITALQEAGQVLPIIRAITQATSVFTTETDFIFRTFVNDKSAKDPFSDDYEGQVIDDISRAALLWWSDINLQVAGSAKYSGRFTAILNKRVELKLPTVFTHLFRGNFNDALALFESMVPIFGDSFVSALESNCAVRIYKFKQPTVDVKAFQM